MEYDSEETCTATVKQNISVGDAYQTTISLWDLTLTGLIMKESVQLVYHS